MVLGYHIKQCYEKSRTSFDQKPHQPALVVQRNLLTLKRIKIPSLNESYIDWSGFQELFKTIVHEIVFTKCSIFGSQYMTRQNS